METLVQADTQRYNRLKNAAETFGFRREAQLIDQKSQEFTDVFSLFVMGQQGAGKSEVVNLLLGRQLVVTGVSQPWVNIYRRSEVGKDFAHVITKNEEGPYQLSLQEARALARGSQLSQVHIEPKSIDRMIWYVDAPSLPLDMAIVEVPGGTPDQIGEHFFWQADGIIWVLRADKLVEEEARRTFSAIQAKKTLPVMSMGVLTHMDKISRKLWLQVLHRVRKMAGADLDAIVPCSIEQSELDLMTEDANVVLLREVRNRFYARASFVQKQNQAHFSSVMGRALSRRFEEFVDRVLINRWSYKQFKVQINEEADRLHEELQHRIQSYIRALKDGALAAAATLEGANGSSALTRAQGTPPVQDFWEGILHGISKKANSTFGQLRYETGYASGAPSQERMWPQLRDIKTQPAPSASFRYDPPPRELLELLRGDRQDAAEAWLETPLYSPGQPMTKMPVPLDTWQAARDWVPSVAIQAEEACSKWLSKTIGQFRTGMSDCAELTFRELHGFLPSEAPVILLPLEKVYEDIRGRKVMVPTPHLPGDGMSPALFLCRMQEEEFVPLWNRQLVQKSFEFVLPRLRRLFLKEIESTRDRITEQWDAARPSIQKRVELVWKKSGRRLTMKNAVKWSIPWVANLMRDRLLDPVHHLGRKQIRLPELHPHQVTLFLGHESQQFHQPLSKPVDEPTEPHVVILNAFQGKLRKRLAQLWRDGKPILVSMKLRKSIRRRSALAVGMMAVFAILWIMMFGTSQVSLTALMAILIPYLITIAYFFKRMIDQNFAAGSGAQADNVYWQVYKRLNARLDAAKQFLKEDRFEEGLMEEIEEELSQHEANSTAQYLSYRELINRLDSVAPLPETESA